VLHSLSARQRALAPAKLVSFAADLGAPGLGLPPAEYAQCAAATIVLHNAWPVNFNLALSSFAPHVAAAVHLLNLARGAGAPFFFSSSVGTVQAARGVVSEAFPDAPHSAAGTGYARSKWVVERILEEHGGRVLRIGQLVGDTEV
jgi:thioester reductase-like protein